ncbi:MAG: Tetratricopeptide repeat protein [Schlesneria sp.]|nr:Tetratricopeptide repeat protein [Schlesneria sp.]
MMQRFSTFLGTTGILLQWTLISAAQVAPEVTPAIEAPKTVVVPPTPVPNVTIVPVAPAPTAINSKVVGRCEQSLVQATASFKQGDYDSSVKILNQALTQCPDDPTLHELRSLVFFAKGDYETASNSSHIALANGRRYWMWPDMIRLYPDVATYTKQLRTLEAYAKKHPADAGARFVQAYHYIVAGYPEAGARELELVVRLQGDDRLAVEVLKTVAKPASPQPVVRQP